MRTELASSLYLGVEHLLRDVKDTTISTLATEVSFYMLVPFIIIFIGGFEINFIHLVFKPSTFSFLNRLLVNLQL